VRQPDPRVARPDLLDTLTPDCSLYIPKTLRQPGALLEKDLAHWRKSLIEELRQI
jgi:hypothetical protein